VLRRRKILLNLLYKLGSAVENHLFQHYLYLFAQEQREQSYYFFPSQSGPYSLEAMVDKRVMMGKEILLEHESWALNNEEDLPEIKPSEHQLINDFVEKYQGMDDVAIYRKVYLKYPYYGINSVYAERFLTDAEYKVAEAARPRIQESGFFTIGYEGKSIDAFLNELVLNDIRMLVDIRRNAMSMKYGFSKRTLKDSTALVGIDYLHLSALGIPSEMRRDIDNIEVRMRLFEQYEQEMLPEQGEALELLLDLYKDRKRIAILCYEKESVMCHRYRVAKAVMEMGVEQVTDL